MFDIPAASHPRGVTAVQDGPTSIRVTWTPPSPPGDTTGYSIVDVNGGNTNTHSLIGLTNGETYTIYIVGTSSILPSAAVEAGTVALTKAIKRSLHYSRTNHPCSFYST